MDNKQAIERIIQAADDIELGALKLDLAAVVHKLRFPMADILARVPGDSLVAQAKAIGVSRQTMYVWKRETARPNAEQARTIAKLTGIPIAHIRADGFMEGIDGRRPGAQTRRRVAKDGGGLPPRPKRLRAKRRRVVSKPSVGGSPRTVRKRPRAPTAGVNVNG
jgi:hypothetical protein